MQFEYESVVPAPSEAVWDRIVTPEGINYELHPIMRMTVPASMRGKSIHDIALGEKVGRSWFLLLGILPIDFDDIVLAERDVGRRFRETSTMFSLPSWSHERTLTAALNGCVVRDRVEFTLRSPFASLPGVPTLVAKMLRRLFVHRHRRLTAWFAEHPR
jgi:ligand-binding SRPBCC domain-containing protein